MMNKKYGLSESYFLDKNIILDEKRWLFFYAKAKS